MQYIYILLHIFRIVCCNYTVNDFYYTSKDILIAGFFYSERIVIKLT